MIIRKVKVPSGPENVLKRSFLVMVKTVLFKHSSGGKVLGSVTKGSRYTTIIQLIPTSGNPFRINCANKAEDTMGLLLVTK